MKLRFYSYLMAACDFFCADLHRTERHLQAVRVWAWNKATAANLKTCNTRAATSEILN